MARKGPANNGRETHSRREKRDGVFESVPKSKGDLCGGSGMGGLKMGVKRCADVTLTQNQTIALIRN